MFGYAIIKHNIRTQYKYVPVIDFTLIIKLLTKYWLNIVFDSNHENEFQLSKNGTLTYQHIKNVLFKFRMPVVIFSVSEEESNPYVLIIQKRTLLMILKNSMAGENEILLIYCLTLRYIFLDLLMKYIIYKELLRYFIIVFEEKVICYTLFFSDNLTTFY